MPPSLNRWRIWRTHAAEHPTRSAMAALPSPPCDSRIARACRVLTALANCRFIRWSLPPAQGRSFRAATFAIERSPLLFAVASTTAVENLCTLPIVVAQVLHIPIVATRNCSTGNGTSGFGDNEGGHGFGRVIVNNVTSEQPGRVIPKTLYRPSTRSIHYERL